VRASIATLVALMLLAAGCGTAGSERDARNAVERLLADVERGDGRGACAQLSEAAVDELERSERKPCEEAVLSLELSGSPVARVQVYSTSAEAELEAGGAAFLDQTPRGWRVSAVGCRPRPGQPYDCELEA
jgi:hypothetical protein